MFKNHVDLIGFIGSDPETRQLENGASMTYFSLATKTTWKNEGGSYGSQTEWPGIVVWASSHDLPPAWQKALISKLRASCAIGRTKSPFLTFRSFHRTSFP